MGYKYNPLLKAGLQKESASGSGDVVGPASATDSDLAQFDGTTGKLLKDGIAVTTTLGSPGTDSNIATEKAVRAAISGAGGGDVSGPASAVDENLAVFDSTTGKLIKDGGVNVSVVNSALQSSDIGTSVQAWDEHLDDIAALVPGVEDTLITSDGLGGWTKKTAADYITDNSLLTTTNTKTLTNKSIDADNNTLTNIGVDEFAPDVMDMFGIVSGMAFDKPAMTIVNDSGLQLDIEKITTGGDMEFQVNGVKATLDCTTGAGVGGKARVALTAGADANTPTTNYIYVTAVGTVATLNASTSLPTGAFTWVGKVVVPDATTWATTGAYGFQRYTEAFLNDSRGALSHQREKLRALGAVYISGGSQTLNITPGSPDIVHLSVASASIYQLHRQTFPTISTGPYYYGNGLNQYEEIADLSSALNLQDGTAISNNQRYNLVFWGAVNIDSGECKLFVNLSSSIYASDLAAESDSDNSADYSVPNDMRSVAFMISRVALKYTTAGGGTFTELGVYSLLGTPPGVRSGGSGAVANTEFVDSTFRIYDNLDATKLIAFEASGITTGNTRTITMPDADTTLLNQTEVTDLTDAGDSALHYHATDRDRANHTGTQTAATISDFDTEVSNNASVTANTAKVTNATHSGDATGDTALTLATVNSDVGSYTNADITVNAKGLITAASSGTDVGITWNEVTGTTQSAAVNNGYITNNAGLVIVTIPDTATLGSVVRITGKGAGGWKLAQNSGETIHFGNTDTTTGVGGSLASTNRYDTVELVCITANTDWVVVSSVGNITVV